VNSTEDYIMSEMVCMAIDFSEETYMKRVLMIKLAKEAALKVTRIEIKRKEDEI
jgi:hypothetical protein